MADIIAVYLFIHTVGLGTALAANFAVDGALLEDHSPRQVLAMAVGWPVVAVLRLIKRGIVFSKEVRKNSWRDNE